MVTRSKTMLGPESRRLRAGLAGLAIAMATGIIGYRLVSDAAWLDAVFMTIITISTVGFEEHVPLDGGGIAVTIAVILIGIISVSVVAVSTAELLFEGHLRRAIEGRRMQRSIADLRDHVIVCGFGRVGVHVASSLSDSGTDFVIVDNDPDKVARLVAENLFHLAGDATEEHVLEAAGLHRARAVVAAVNSDADNVMITLTAKGLRPSTQVIARVKADENEGKLRRAGADRVIAPTTIGGRRIAQLLTRPVVADFLDSVAAGGVDILLEEVPIRQGADLEGHTLREIGLRQRYHCTVVAVRSAEELDTHPSPDRRLNSGDVIVVMGDQDAIDRLRGDYA